METTIITILATMMFWVSADLSQQGHGFFSSKESCTKEARPPGQGPGFCQRIHVANPAAWWKSWKIESTWKWKLGTHRDNPWRCSTKHCTGCSTGSTRQLGSISTSSSCDMAERQGQKLAVVFLLFNWSDVHEVFPYGECKLVAEKSLCEGEGNGRLGIALLPKILHDLSSLNITRF